jgi:dTDP-glucose 4,6-dehydratase
MTIKGNTILITGGAGFIGSSVTRRLIGENRIIIYDNLWRNAIKDTDLLSHPNLVFIQGDILDYAKLKETIDEFEPGIVLHMSAIAGIDTVIKSPTGTLRINIIGTYNILEALKSRASKLKRFIDFSTSEVFGIRSFKTPESYATSLQPVGAARWVYAASKLSGEHLTHAYYQEFRLPAVIVRPFNVYGPGQVGEGAIHVFVKRALMNEELQIHGAGDQIRSWCYIDDMIDGTILCLEKEEAVGNIFNIGNPRGTVTITSLAEKIVQLCHSASRIVYIPKNYVDVDLRIPNIEKAGEILGFEPRYGLDEGLIKTIDWYREHVVQG